MELLHFSLVFNGKIISPIFFSLKNQMLPFYFPITILSVYIFEMGKDFWTDQTIFLSILKIVFLFLETGIFWGCRGRRYFFEHSWKQGLLKTINLYCPFLTKLVLAFHFVCMEVYHGSRIWDELFDWTGSQNQTRPNLSRFRILSSFQH